MPARFSIEDLRSAKLVPRQTTRGTVPGSRVLETTDPLGRLAPGSAADILDRALDALVERGGACLGMAVLFWLSFGQISGLLATAGLSEWARVTSSFLWGLAGIVPEAFTTAIVASVIGNGLTGGGMPIGAQVLRGLRRGPGVLAILFVTRVLALPLSFLCLVPYLCVQWLSWSAPALHVLASEQLLTSAERERARSSPAAWVASGPRRVVRALRRSVRLSRGWGALGRFAVLWGAGWLLVVLPLSASSVSLNLPESREFLRANLHLGPATAEFLLSSLSALLGGLSSTVMAAVATSYALDLRTRREGLDLEAALQGLGSGTGAAAVGA